MLKKEALLTLRQTRKIKKSEQQKSESKKERMKEKKCKGSNLTGCLHYLPPTHDAAECSMQGK